MDVEQRIGRIHRYGQQHTAQVYNLVLSDTIKGRIFLLLMDKLKEIARTLGKVDEQGNVAEDLRTQILGQLAERLTYDTLYREALSDPELRRTTQELDAAMANATEARKVVFELFQDLDGFSLEEYRPFADVAAGFDRVVRFLRASLSEQGRPAMQLDRHTFTIPSSDGESEVCFTTDRELAREHESVELMGLDHPLMSEALQRWQGLDAETIGVSIVGDQGPAVVSWWLIRAEGKEGDQRSFVQSLAVTAEGRRVPKLERPGIDLLARFPGPSSFSLKHRRALLHDAIEPMLQRELNHRGLVPEDGGYSAKLYRLGRNAPKKPGIMPADRLSRSARWTRSTCNRISPAPSTELPQAKPITTVTRRPSARKPAKMIVVRFCLLGRAPTRFVFSLITRE